MLYLFYGLNQDKARGKWRQVIAAFGKKYPAGAVFRYDAEHFDPAEFEELISGTDLFGEKRLVVGDRLLENDEAGEFFEAKVELIAAGANTFAFLETAVSKELIKKIEKFGGKVEEAKTSPKASAAAPFNIFALSDALGSRDRKRLWLLYQEALRAGFSEEDIFWKFVWQIKTLLLVLKSGSVAPKSLKPFVLDKTRRSLRNFKEGELEKLSGDLVAIWHDARRGLLDFDVALEKFALSV